MAIGDNINGKVGVCMNDSSKTTKKINYSSQYSEGWIPIRDITNGMIVLDNRYKVTGIKIVPRNIFILDQWAQDNIINGLKNFYNTIDYEFWLISADRPVDISSYLAKLRLLYNDASSPVMRKLIDQDIKKANEFMDNNVTDIEYYILFKEKDDALIQKRIRNLISGLANCGLEAHATSNQDLRVLLDSFFNGNATSNFGTVIPS